MKTLLRSHRYRIFSVALKVNKFNILYVVVYGISIWLSKNYISPYFLQTDPFVEPCPIGYTNVRGHVDNTHPHDKMITFEGCKEKCTNEFHCVSFEFCGYSCDMSMGPPYANRCLINYENLPEIPSLQNFFRCSKGIWGHNSPLCCTWKLYIIRKNYISSFLVYRPILETVSNRI